MLEFIFTMVLMYLVVGAAAFWYRRSTRADSPITEPIRTEGTN